LAREATPQIAANISPKIKAIKARNGIGFLSALPSSLSFRGRSSPISALRGKARAEIGRSGD